MYLSTRYQCLTMWIYQELLDILWLKSMVCNMEYMLMYNLYMPTAVFDILHRKFKIIQCCLPTPLTLVSGCSTIFPLEVHHCCLPTPMTLASGWSPMFPLVVHHSTSPSILPAVPSLQWGLSTNPEVTMWCVCGCS